MKRNENENIIKPIIHCLLVSTMTTALIGSLIMSGLWLKQRYSSGRLIGIQERGCSQTDAPSIFVPRQQYIIPANLSNSMLTMKEKEEPIANVKPLKNESNSAPRFPLKEIVSVDSDNSPRIMVFPSLLASDTNQEMDRKLAAADLSPAYAEEMIATWRDRENDELVRNFAVQHLERYARECVVRGTWDPDSSDAADVRAALEEAVLETGTSVGGAALLALARLSEIDPHVDRTRLGARASSLVSNSSIPAANRVSAAQVCGLLRVRSALPALRSLSSDSSAPTPLRLAAAHAAGLVSESR